MPQALNEMLQWIADVMFPADPDDRKAPGETLSPCSVRIRSSRKASRLDEPPLCAYPALPRYPGKGDPTAAVSFECR